MIEDNIPISYHIYYIIRIGTYYLYIYIKYILLLLLLLLYNKRFRNK